MAPGGSDDFGHRSASATANEEHDGLSAPVELTFSFGPFRLSPRRQLLLKGDTPVPLGVVPLKFCLLWSSAPAKWSTRIRS